MELIWNLRLQWLLSLLLFLEQILYRLKARETLRHSLLGYNNPHLIIAIDRRTEQNPEKIVEKTPYRDFKLWGKPKPKTGTLYVDLLKPIIWTFLGR